MSLTTDDGAMVCIQLGHQPPIHHDTAEVTVTSTAHVLPRRYQTRLITPGEPWWWGWSIT
jgi:hypothetical protein